MGEGGHNYHHTFPQDYRTSEYVLHFNVTKLFIDILFFLGLAYDMKVVPQEVIFNATIKIVMNYCPIESESFPFKISMSILAKENYGKVRILHV